MHNLTPRTMDFKTAIKGNGFLLIINHDTIKKHTTQHYIQIKQQTHIDLTMNKTFVIVKKVWRKMSLLFDQNHLKKYVLKLFRKY